MHGFVYIWYDRKHKRFYIGSHWGTEDDGYVCSSRWMKKAYQRRPHDFRRRVIQRITTNRKDMFAAEQIWLNKIKDHEIGGYRYYNLRRHATNWHGKNEEEKRTIGQKISAKNKGRVKTDEHRQKLSVAHKGKKLSDEHRQKLSVAHTGKIRGPHSEEHKRKLSESRKFFEAQKRNEICTTRIM